MDTSISLQQPGAMLDFPSGQPISNTTHLGIGAHADDLEIMAYHGIAICYESQTSLFSGITVTNGVGSPQHEETKLEQEELRKVRQQEQLAAAQMGRYGFIAQLDYPSSKLKDPNQAAPSEEIFNLLQKAKPDVVYLHQSGDKHPTHIAVLRASIEALRMLPAEDRPEKVYGCEVWRDLDWLPDDKKIYLPTDAHPELALNIIYVFQSQIRAGVAYNKGALGRRLANGTFANPHIVKQGDSFSLAMDLMPVVRGDVSLKELTLGLVEDFYNHVDRLLSE